MKKSILILILTVVVLACGQPRKTSQTDTVKPIELTQEMFLSRIADYQASPHEWKYLGDKPAVIDFYASWCGPCKTMAPVLEELAAAYGDSVYVYKVNVDQQKDLATIFRINLLPSLLFIPMEGQLQMSEGAMSKEELKETIDRVLLNKPE